MSTLRLSALLLATTLMLGSGAAFAERGTTTFEGPGFKVEQKKGLFGSSKRTYRDAFGNKYEKKRNWFGRETSNTNLLGGTVTQSGRNTEVRLPDGTTVVKKKKSLLRGEETTINGNAIFDGLSNWLKPGSSQPSQSTTP